jgi:rare lipoprotein A
MEIDMRFFALAAVAALSVAVADARPASAAWECMGPAVACGDSSRAANKPSYKKASRAERASKQAYRSAAAKPRAVRKSSGSVASYGGGSSGIASYYWQGQQTASGARFNPNGLTAAHRTLPFGTRVRVTNQSNGRSVVVTINDRGPFIKGRIIDLSRGAAQVIGMTGAGLARVSVDRL